MSPETAAPLFGCKARVFPKSKDLPAAPIVSDTHPREPFPLFLLLPQERALRPSTMVCTMTRINSNGPVTGGSTSLDPSFDSLDEALQQGTMLGERAVRLQGGEISLADSAEELSLHMAEKTEEKHHAEREVKSEKPLETMLPEEIVEFFDDSHDVDAQAKLEELAGKLLNQRGAPRQEAGKAFGDNVTKQYLGLQYALRRGEKDGADPDILESLRDALADLELESGPEIRADLNTMQTAGEFATDAGGVARFQDTYRDIVMGEGTLAKTLDLALERFGTQDVGRGLKSLIAALGQDLSAARPSTDANRLQSLITDMYHLEVAATVLEGCGELSEKLAGQGEPALDSSRLMRDLVGLTGEKWLSESRFTTLAQDHGVKSPQGTIAFLSGARTVLRDLPVQMFPDGDTRQNVLNALQGALDTAIDAEEE